MREVPAQPTRILYIHPPYCFSHRFAVAMTSTHKYFISCACKFGDNKPGMCMDIILEWGSSIVYVSTPNRI